MTSNFLRDIGRPSVRSRILSASELIAREAIDLHKGMNFRDETDRISVFLVLEREGGYKDEWHPQSGMYVYEGHDSTTVEHGKLTDQILTYESGTLTDNGTFYKAANECKDGVRQVPLQVQVYEKLDAGAWYDKGIFDLIDAAQVVERGRRIFKFYLQPANAHRMDVDEMDEAERMIPAASKARAWQLDRGRCADCGSEADLHVVAVSGEQDARLACREHSGRAKRGLL